MRAPVIPEVHIRRAVIATTLAATVLLAGCAVEAPGIGRSTAAPTCGMNAVLYCELAPHVETCQCFRHSEIRDAMRTFSRR